MLGHGARGLEAVRDVPRCVRSRVEGTWFGVKGLPLRDAFWCINFRISRDRDYKF